MIQEPKRKGDRPPDGCYSTLQVARLVGVTYRMLDYWLRMGMVYIEREARGSGTRRWWTLDEVRRLKRLVALKHDAEEVLSEFADGSLWEATGRDPDLPNERNIHDRREPRSAPA